MRTIVVGVDVPADTDPNGVVVLVSAPDGTVSGTWLGGDLPVDAPVNDGDLVSYLYVRSDWSYAHTFRVTPEVIEVNVEAFLRYGNGPCALDEPMMIAVDIPEVEGANDFDFRLRGAVPMTPSIDAGPALLEVRACPGTPSFDLLLVAKDEAYFPFGNALAFARIDAIPYVPGSTISLPIVMSEERALVDIVLEADPGTTFSVNGTWIGDGFGNFGGKLPVWSSTGEQIGDSGTAQLSYGPLAIGPEQSWARATTPGYFDCENYSAWKVTPFDGAPLVAKKNALAGFAPTADGNVGIASDGGEVGDVMVRTQDNLASATWYLHEDPSTQFPLPEKPPAPTALLPDFQWPSGGDITYSHEDDAPIVGYADYAKLNVVPMDGRNRRRTPYYCP